MKFHQINDNLRIPYVGQGFGGIRDGSKGSDLDEEDYIDSLLTGVEHGLTLIDTAEAYADGYSEEIIGKAVLGIRKDIQLATKFSPENNGYKDVIAAAERSLVRLKTDYIDLYQIHWPNPMIPIEETIRALEVLMRQGKVLTIGVSNFSKRDLVAAIGALSSSKIVSNQVEYNLFDRFAEESLFPFCKTNDLKIIAYSPLDKGRTTDGDQRRKVLADVAQKYGKSVEQIALNWLTASGMVVAIPTSRSKNHIIDNSKSNDFELDRSDYELINEKCTSKPELIETKKISVSLSGEGNRLVYQTMAEAKQNLLNLCPSPLELAEFIKQGDPIKPVRLRPGSMTGDTQPYELIEGRLRYWAWVLAYNGEKPIPAYIRYD
jgi:diketogulonate reductase-like aldo/keto reductase